MKPQTIFIALAVAFGVYMLTNRRQVPANWQTDPRTRPPVDPRQARTQAQLQALQQWVLSMVALFGNVRELWQPGGPFYGIPKQIFDDINIKPPVPGSDTGGQYV